MLVIAFEAYSETVPLIHSDLSIALKVGVYISAISGSVISKYPVFAIRNRTLPFLL